VSFAAQPQEVDGAGCPAAQRRGRGQQGLCSLLTFLHKQESKSARRAETRPLLKNQACGGTSPSKTQPSKQQKQKRRQNQPQAKTHQAPPAINFTASFT